MSIPKYDVCNDCGNLLMDIQISFDGNGYDGYTCLKCGNKDSRNYVQEYQAREKQKEVLIEIRNRKIDKLLGED